MKEEETKRVNHSARVVDSFFMYHKRKKSKNGKGRRVAFEGKNEKVESKLANLWFC